MILRVGLSQYHADAFSRTDGILDWKFVEMISSSLLRRIMTKPAAVHPPPHHYKKRPVPAVNMRQQPTVTINDLRWFTIISTLTLVHNTHLFRGDLVYFTHQPIVMTWFLVLGTLFELLPIFKFNIFDWGWSWFCTHFVKSNMHHW